MKPSYIQKICWCVNTHILYNPKHQDYFIEYLTSLVVVFQFLSLIQLFCNSMNFSPSDKNTRLGAISFSIKCFQLKDQMHVSCIGREVLYLSHQVYLLKSLNKSHAICFCSIKIMQKTCIPLTKFIHIFTRNSI